MQRFEYHVVPAPRRGEKARGVKTTEDRFALALTQVMNQLGGEGWEYVRADTLPCDERSGFTGTKTTYQNLLVFRRPIRSLSEDLPERPAMRIFKAEAPAQPQAQAPIPTLRLGPAESPVGPAPAVGSAKQDLAAE